MEVDSVVRHWMSLTMEDKSTNHEVLGMAVRSCMGVFIVDFGMVGLREPELLQGAINVFIRLFRRVGLMENVATSKTMMCPPGYFYQMIV